MIHPQYCGRTGSNLLRDLTKEKYRGFLFELDHPFLLLVDIGALVLGPLDIDRDLNCQASCLDRSHTNIFLGSLAY